jgi:LuxR family maltose regulon positive regulatory protein
MPTIGRAIAATGRLGDEPPEVSFPQIAERAHVSANTVKTQASAVHRKLDASSRCQAVARARRVGLLDGLGR